ncbi:MAG: aminotransferase class V-fold PLP-dependent enzyme [Hydrogenophilales bacterium]|nr:aminotransferase class V-fold PLP-dependent enzyme [Hydrogenophilales bacterium]
MTAQTASIYLDHNATTPVAPECVEPMLSAMRDAYANPASKHSAGERAKQIIEQARAQVARLLGAASAEIVFTSGGTESNHLALLGALGASPGKRHIVISAVEHPSTLDLLAQLETQGVRVTRLPVDGEGRLDLMTLERALTPGTALLSLMWANNETGVVFPVEEAAHIAKSKGVLLHTDAVQVAGKHSIDLARIPADLLSLSGHKLHAPKGVGVLFVRKGLKFPPMLFGQQERGRRGGTQNVPGIVGLGIASRLACEQLEAKAGAIGALRDRLENGILARLPIASINGGMAPRVSNTSNVRFGELEGEAILARLDQAGICASSGAACTAGGSEPSHVLRAMGCSDAEAQASIRFSLSRYTTEVEIDQTINALCAIVKRMTAEAA